MSIMKHNYSIVHLVLVLILFSTCSKKIDNTAYPIGKWALVKYTITNLPIAYASHEGEPFEVSALPSDDLEYESYSKNLEQDRTYTINAKGIIRNDELTDNGSWSIKQNKLILESHQKSELEYRIVANEQDELILSRSASLPLIPDEVYSKQDFSDITHEDFLDLYEDVDVDLQYVFIRTSY